MAEERRFVFANFSRSTLAARITASTTELRLAEGEGDRFPSPDGTYDEICSIIVKTTTQYEVMYCTARSGDVLTVERGKEGTTAQVFAAGTAVVHNVTAGFFEQAAIPPPVESVTLLGEVFALEGLGIINIQNNEQLLAVFGVELQSVSQSSNSLTDFRFVDEAEFPEDVLSIRCQNSAVGGYTLLAEPDYNFDPGEYSYATAPFTSADNGNLVEIIFSRVALDTLRLKVTVADLGGGLLGQNPGVEVQRGTGAAPVGVSSEDTGFPVNIRFYFADSATRDAFLTENAGRFIKVHQSIIETASFPVSFGRVGNIAVDDAVIVGNDLTWVIPSGQFAWAAGDIGETARIEVYTEPA